MKKMIRTLALVLALALCTLSMTVALAEDAAATPDTNEVLVTVNGVAILRGDVDIIAENLLYNYSTYGYDTSDPAFLDQVYAYALDYAIQLEMMRQKGVEWGLDQFTEEELAAMKEQNAAEWNETVDYYVMYYSGLPADATEEEMAQARADIIAQLAAMGETEEAWLAYTLENAMYDRVEAEMVKGAAVTEEEVEAAYQARAAEDEATYKNDVVNYEYMTTYYGAVSYYMPEGYRGISHILLAVDETLLNEYLALSARYEEQINDDEVPAEETPAADAPAEETPAEATAEPVEPVTLEQVEAARDAVLASVQTTVDEIMAKLNDGVPFEELIDEYGTDPGMTTEPYRTNGYDVHLDSLYVPEFIAGAFSLENIGDVSAPFVSEFGVHIVKYVRDVPAGPVPLTEEMRETLRAELLTAKEDELFIAKIEEWRAAAEIVYSEAGEAIRSAGTETAE